MEIKKSPAVPGALTRPENAHVCSSLLPGHIYQRGMELSDPFLWPAGMCVFLTVVGRYESLGVLDIVPSEHEAADGSSYGSIV